MKEFKIIAVTLLTALVASLASAQLTLNFQALTGSQIYFSGGSFSFTPVNSDQFSISSVENGVGDSTGLSGGLVPGGPFAIGGIMTSNFTLGPLNLEVQTATVTGSSTLFITDLNNVNLTGSIQWDNITTTSTVGSGAGTLDLSGVINLTGITYMGANSDLSELAGAGQAVDTITFQYNSDQTLSSLVASSGTGTSYSGTITAAPEPGILTLVGAGFTGLLSLRVLRRR